MRERSVYPASDLPPDLVGKDLWYVALQPLVVDRRLPTHRDMEAALAAARTSVGTYVEFPACRDVLRRNQSTTEFVGEHPDGYHEWCRLHQTGTFVSHFEFLEDHERAKVEAQFGPAPEGAAGFLRFERTIHLVTIIVEFAARWAAATRLDAPMLIVVTLGGHGGRRLFSWNDEGNRFSDVDRSHQEVRVSKEVSPEWLRDATERMELVLSLLSDLFLDFNQQADSTRSQVRKEVLTLTSRT